MISNLIVKENNNNKRFELRMPSKYEYTITKYYKYVSQMKYYKRNIILFGSPSIDGNAVRCNPINTWGANGFSTPVGFDAVSSHVVEVGAEFVTTSGNFWGGTAFSPAADAILGVATSVYGVFDTYIDSNNFCTDAGGRGNSMRAYHQVQKDTHYWLKQINDHGTLSLYYSLDGENYELGCSGSFPNYSCSTLLYGASKGGGNRTYSSSTYYLKGCYIKQDDVELWRGAYEVSENDEYDFTEGEIIVVEGTADDYDFTETEEVLVPATKDDFDNKRETKRKYTLRIKE